MAMPLAHLFEAARRGEAARRRGQLSEARSMRVLLKGSPRPWWFKSARAANPDEDALGIDIVVDCVDRRRLWLQVKSSPTGVEKFLRKKPLGARIGVVLVLVGERDEQLYGRILGALFLLREDMGL